jgi:Arc/MetJ-type ribon-helix-helix transcriptional regulator
MKLKKTVTINQELLDWINQKIEEREFASLSHAVEKGLYKLKKSYEQSEKKSPL